ncbi:hypothetical protein Dda_5164 [Drechslerella dactyloides]|uniref:Uncharacterized protein n=1 Tax=Drechslerella dactyloides TaxID=74499 RepID=A0AAD6J010_DREDA|nr:hypothetical protein Dda_5164 [Drechslerella dactyloides]
MSEFRFRVPGFTRPNPPALSEDLSAAAASPTSTNAYSTSMKSKFRITQFVRESKHVDGAKAAASGDETPKRPSVSAASAASAATTAAASSTAVNNVNHVHAAASAEKQAGASYKSSDRRMESKDANSAATGGPSLAPKPGEASSSSAQLAPAISKAKVRELSSPAKTDGGIVPDVAISPSSCPLREPARLIRPRVQQARRSLPNLKLVPPTHFTPALAFADSSNNNNRTPPPVDPSRSVEWNKVVRSIQATSLEAIVTKLLDALSDHPESGPGTLVAHLGDIFLDDATKQMYRQARAMDPRLLPVPSAPGAGTPVSNGMTPVGAASMSSSTPTPHTAPHSAVARLPTPATTQRRSLSGAIPRQLPGGMLIAPKLFEPREYKPNNARKLKRKSEADKDGSVSRLLSMKRNASLGELSHLPPVADSPGAAGEPPVKRKRGRPKGSTKAAIQERESLKMQATAAEQVSETLTETTTIATESVSPVLEEERSPPTGTSIELRASSPSPRPDTIA